MSLRHKQTLIIMLTSSLVLLLACAAFSIYNDFLFARKWCSIFQPWPKSWVQYFRALDFNDSNSALETLSALQAQPELLAPAFMEKAEGLRRL